MFKKYKFGVLIHTDQQCYLRKQEAVPIYPGLPYEMIGETQPEIEFLEVAALIFPFLLKAWSSILSATRI